MTINVNDRIIIRQNYRSKGKIGGWVEVEREVIVLKVNKKTLIVDIGGNGYDWQRKIKISNVVKKI